MPRSTQTSHSEYRRSRSYKPPTISKASWRRRRRRARPCRASPSCRRAPARSVRTIVSMLLPEGVRRLTSVHAPEASHISTSPSEILSGLARCARDDKVVVARVFELRRKAHAAARRPDGGRRRELRRAYHSRGAGRERPYQKLCSYHHRVFRRERRRPTPASRDGELRVERLLTNAAAGKVYKMSLRKPFNEGIKGGGWKFLYFEADLSRRGWLRLRSGLRRAARTS